MAVQQNYPQGPQATFVYVPTVSGQSEKERIEKLFPKKTIKDLSIAQLIFGGIAAFTQVILFPGFLSNKFRVTLNKPSLGYTNCQCRPLWLLWGSLCWNWPLDRIVFCHCRWIRANGIPETISFHSNSIHGLEHYCVSFCLTINRFFWYWNGRIQT